MSEAIEAANDAANEALRSEKALAALLEELEGSSRLKRQKAAGVLAAVAKANPSAVAAHSDAFVDALNRPEARTRWECLDVLSCVIAVDSRACDKAIAGAEMALFDEESGPVRLAAMRFLCKLGATTENRSEKVWPLIDEGIQCYHGDLEFSDMLSAVTDFAGGKLAAGVKAELVERMSFDASNGKGALKRRAQQIIDNVQGK